MNPDPIARALERLDGVSSYDSLSTVAKPLAALIREAAEPFKYHLHLENVVLEVCRVCNTRNNSHAPDCALIALCAAISGEPR